MQKLILSGIFLFLIVFPSYAFADGPYLNIPPTNAFDKVRTNSGSVYAANFSMPINIVGGTGVTVTGNNATHTVTITNTQAVNSHAGTYNQTYANNVLINSGGHRYNFINSTGNPVNVVNDPTRDQVNVTISSSGGAAGVSSLNALAGALTIAAVPGNTTVTTSGGNTITINTAYNIVTTGLSAQVITKGLTLNALTLGGNAAGGNKNFTGLADVNGTRFFQNGKQVLDTLVQGSGISITGSGNSRTITNTGVLSAITSVNSQTGPSINIVCQTGNTTCTNSTNQIKIGFGVNPVITGGAAQTISKQVTHSADLIMSGANINLGTNGLTNSGHKSTLPLTSGTLCQTNQSSTCGTNSGVTSITGTAHNVTASSSTGAVTLNTGDNVVVTNGATQNFTKLVIHNAGITMSHSNINLGANALNTTTYGINQGTIVGDKAIEITPSSGNLDAALHLLPSGTKHISYIQLWRNSNYSTNREYLSFGTDLKGTGEYDIFPSATGTGVLHPINILNAIKLESFDVANTITSYVQNIWTPISDPTTAFTNAIWKSSTNADVLKYRNNANTTTYNILSTLSATNATTGQLSGNGTGTSSASLVMDGVYATLTPANTGRITVTVSGGYKSSVTSDGCIIGIRQSTSNMGGNGVAVAGSALGGNLHFLSAVGGDASGFSRTYDFTGTVGTKYFFDLSFARITGGTCTLQDINWDLVEH